MATKNIPRFNDSDNYVKREGINQGKSYAEYLKEAGIELPGKSESQRRFNSPLKKQVRRRKVI